jgi:hypothetical protein
VYAVCERGRVEAVSTAAASPPADEILSKRSSKFGIS